MCSCFTKKQEPTNREAFPRSSVRQLASTTLLGQICKQSNAETPKPPTYPFKSFNFQRARRQKTTGTPISWCNLQPCLQIFLLRSASLLSVWFKPCHHVLAVSVRRCLGPSAKTCKRKMHHDRHFLAAPPFFLGPALQRKAQIHARSYRDACRWPPREGGGAVILPPTHLGHPGVCTETLQKYARFTAGTRCGP